MMRCFPQIEKKEKDLNHHLESELKIIKRTKIRKLLKKMKK